MASLNKVQVDGNSYTIDATTLNGRPASDYLLKSEVYPVGSIYISLNSTNPSSIFGGTWEQIQGRFLLGASGSHPVNQTGGEENVTLITQNLPKDTYNCDGELTSSMKVQGKLAADQYGNGSGIRSRSDLMGQAHNNMPPYLAVYMWKRTA